ncbi:unnamed protein product [Bursaphelenchus xylophilus]|uniref:Glutathione S-transferase kappa n=1 Tax=Bursaphelenchus xylophilus TaxID=6326 RepID=A0A1I7S2P0_BURXY|nr:unnamed protein product [Bursaphelenchus xylophilus]CAG9121779.1 unnamed protein product [Bursaphelenchus xylophilus]
MSEKPEIHFYFDVVSPFSFVMFEALQQYKHRLPAKVIYKPSSLRDIFKTAKNTGPIANPVKAVYIAEVFPRLCRYWNVSIANQVVMDKRMGVALFTHSTIKALRLCLVVLQEQPHEFTRLVRFFWHNIFLDRKFFETQNDIAEVCKTLNYPIEYVDRAESDEIKKILAQNTEMASKEGAFGVPYIVLKQAGQKPQHFFGVESFPQLCDALHIKYEGHIPSKL